MRGSGGSAWAHVPASSFGSYRSGGGSGVPFVSIVSDDSTSRLPQPEYLSRPAGHSAQPVAGETSSAPRSSSHDTWSGVSVGSCPSRSAAAAETCGAANDVPIASRNSSGPQIEYGPSGHAVAESARSRGMVEKIPSPGAEMSLKTASRFE